MALDNIKTKLKYFLSSMRKKLFGENNERLDFIMDSFYKLDAKQQQVFTGCGLLMLLGLIMGAFYIYASNLSAYRSEIKESYQAINEINLLVAKEKNAEVHFKNIIKKVSSKSRNSLKPYFEKLLSSKNLPVKGIQERTKNLGTSSLLSEYFSEIHVDLRLAKISIPKLLDLVISIEKSGMLLLVDNLKISQLYGDNLYFDAHIKVRGFKSIKKV